MNVCLVSEEYPEETNFGGISTYQKTVAEELVKQGNNVYVLCRGLYKDLQYKENGVNIYRFFIKQTKNQIRNHIKYRKKIKKTLLNFQKQEMIDIIETPDWGAETIFFEKYRKIPLVVRLHTPLKIWLQYNNNDFGKITKKMLKWEKKMLINADYLTCCSNVLKRLIIKNYNLSNKDILVTPNPANTMNFFKDEKIKKDNSIVFVGSLEERKGVILLAKALNIVFNKYPLLKVNFIGKDTNRNYKNISTKTLITNIVKKENRKNISFLGHIENKNLNFYLNKSLVGVYPSLFDNFPYVLLESMAVGLHIVGSKNSGMVEMLNDSSSIYNTGNCEDLAKKIIEKYEQSLNNKYCQANIDRVRTEYNTTKICRDIVKLYSNIIKKYYPNIILKREIKNVFYRITKEKVKSIKRVTNGVANLVFKVNLESNTKYIIKKYLYKYDFALANDLYNAYLSNNIDVIKPLTERPILYNEFLYNIFEYKKEQKIFKKINIEFLKKLLCSKRDSIIDNTVIKKCNKYYKFLIKIPKQDLIINNNDFEYVKGVYKKNFNSKVLKGNYLNHGDISIQNILISKGKNYLIDFDEVCISSPLYDFAVIIIKMCIKRNKIIYSKYEQLMECMKKVYPQYSNYDYKCSVKLYLCKILLEKYYYHQIKQINLFSKNQMKDNYKKYLKILKNM